MGLLVVDLVCVNFKDRFEPINTLHQICFKFRRPTLLLQNAMNLKSRVLNFILIYILHTLKQDKWTVKLMEQLSEDKPFNHYNNNKRSQALNL